MTTSTTLPPTDLSAEQQAAIDELRAEFGRRWKSRLSAAWMHGTEERLLPGSGGMLRQIRNSHGPKWLGKA